MLPAEAPVARPGRHDPVAFARLLRRAGLAVPVSSVVTFTRALAELGLDRPDGVYWAGRTTLVRRGEDLPTYDRCFAAFFLGCEPTRGPEPPAPVHTVAYDEPASDRGVDDGDGPEPEPDTSVRWSRLEVLRHRDLAACTEAELAELWQLVATIRLAGSLRPSRRTVPDRRAGAALDLRRTVREALRTGGEPVRRRTRRPGTRERRVVLLVDVSGSMEPYARGLLRFANAAVLARRSVEVFTLGTRLTRLSRELATRDPDAALRRATAAVADFSGGTRLGDTVREFNDRWGVRGLARGADVVILSDGWDRGEPEELAEQMARLHRVAHRVIWVNPLKASPGYAPLARGMAAALPHVDRFVEGHSVASLQELAALVVGD